MLSIIPLAAALALTGQTELEPGTTYRGPLALKVSSEGVRFRIARGWVGQLPPNAEAIVMQRPGGPGVILAAVQRTTRKEALARMSSPIPVEPGVVLTPSGKIKATKNRLSGRYATPNHEGYIVVRLRPDGRAVTVIGLAPKGNLAPVRKAVDRFARNVAFYAPKKARPVRAAQGVTASPLAGRKLHRFYGDYGYREHQIMVLCRTGRFFWNMEAGGVTRGVASGAATSRGQGSWSVTGDQLRLQWDSGEARTYRVEHRRNGLYLDGQRWLREAGGC